MSKYIAFLILVVVSVAQVSWAGFMIIFGVVFPLVFLYVWALNRVFSFNVIILYGFIGGVLVDLLSASLIGLHALALLLGIGLAHLIEKHTIYNEMVSLLVSFCASTGVYILLIRYLPIWINSL